MGMNALPICLPVGPSLKALLLTLDVEDFERFLAAKAFAESALLGMIERHNGLPAYRVCLDGIQLDIAFSRKWERFYIARFEDLGGDPFPKAPRASYASLTKAELLLRVVGVDTVLTARIPPSPPNTGSATGTSGESVASSLTEEGGGSVHSEVVSVGWPISLVYGPVRQRWLRPDENHLRTDKPFAAGAPVALNKAAAKVGSPFLGSPDSAFTCADEGAPI